MTKRMLTFFIILYTVISISGVGMLFFDTEDRPYSYVMGIFSVTVGIIALITCVKQLKGTLTTKINFEKYVQFLFDLYILVLGLLKIVKGEYILGAIIFIVGIFGVIINSDFKNKKDN